MIAQEGKPASSRWRARDRAGVMAVVGMLTLLAAAVGARGGGGPARAASVADLAQLRDQAVAVLDRLQLKGSTGYSVGIDPSMQRIGVYVFLAPDAPLPDLVGLQASLGAQADLHTVTGTPHALARIKGGESVVVDARRLRCTNGFAIALRDGRQGFLTAGHCFDVTRPASKQSARTFDGLPLTGVQYNVDPSDWGILALDNASDEAVALVDDGAGGRPVRAVVSPSFGMPICKMGIATAVTCGKVTLLDAQVVVNPIRDANGVVIVPAAHHSGLIQDDLCVEEGDSGAPVYAAPAQGQNAPVDAVAIGSMGMVQKDVTGRDVCLERLKGPGTSVGFAVPLAAISAATTNPFTVKTSG